jgi:hypothetical protein
LTTQHFTHAPRAGTRPQDRLRRALLPLTAEVGTALRDYLQHGRPDTAAKQVFVLHWLRPRAPISHSIVGCAADNALRRAGIDAPSAGEPAATFPGHRSARARAGLGEIVGPAEGQVLDAGPASQATR